MNITQVVREKIDAWFNRRLFIPAFEMSDENINRFVMQLSAYKPVLVDGYAESFNFLAQYLKDRKIVGFKPKAIVSSAQALPDHSREIIEKSFECGVFDKYGSREFSGIAYECDAHEGHHVCAESYVVEIMKDGRPARPGELGEVVVTDLNNLCLPMIRYRVGDLAVAMDTAIVCHCGRGLPRIGKIEGRVQSMIIGKGGKYIPGTFFAHLFKDYGDIVRQYQILQEEIGVVQLKIIRGQKFVQLQMDKVINDLRNYLGDETELRVEFVEKIQMVRTGKHQGSISKLKFDFQNVDSIQR